MRSVMNTFAKLNLKDQTDIVIVNAPASFEPEVASLRGITVRRALSDAKQVVFSLAFATTQKEVDAVATAIARKAAGMQSSGLRTQKESKKYTCEFGRDRGGRHGRGGLTRAHGRDRRRLVGRALPSRGVHQEHDAASRIQANRARQRHEDHEE